MTRPRLAKLTGLASEAGRSIRRLRAGNIRAFETEGALPARVEAEEARRRLEATRERLRRQAPPPPRG